MKADLDIPGSEKQTGSEKRASNLPAPEGGSGPAPGVSVCVLASGSKGNAVHVSDGAAAVLFDAGLSGREIERRMADRNLSMNKVRAIVVSHEHADHVRGVGVLARRYHLPVYMTEKTSRAAHTSLKAIPETRYFTCGIPFALNGFSIHPFSLSHDAADPAGFTITRGQSKMAIATDMGMVTTLVKQHLKDCRLLILEANHDPEMLATGPYPWPLKQRVKGRTGHLSNPETRDLLGEVRHDDLRHVILAHLSEQNNTPGAAIRAITPALNGYRTCLSVARQHITGDVIAI